MYTLTIKERNGRALDTRKVSTDDELFQYLGRFSVWYFLAIDRVDYADAVHTLWGAEDGSDRLLAFTALKDTDEIDGPHRHGLAKGVLAIGAIWFEGSKRNVSLIVEQEAQ